MGPATRNIVIHWQCARTSIHESRLPISPRRRMATGVSGEGRGRHVQHIENATTDY